MEIRRNREKVVELLRKWMNYLKSYKDFTWTASGKEAENLQRDSRQFSDICLEKSQGGSEIRRVQ